MAINETYCWYCGDSLGIVDGRSFYRRGTCGRRECEDAARDEDRMERAEAHEDLDRRMGW